MRSLIEYYHRELSWQLPPGARRRKSSAWFITICLASWPAIETDATMLQFGVTSIRGRRRCQCVENNRKVCYSRSTSFWRLSRSPPWLGSGSPHARPVDQLPFGCEPAPVLQNVIAGTAHIGIDLAGDRFKEPFCNDVKRPALGAT
jgi:hypothetical protein